MFKRTAAVIDKTLKDFATLSYWMYVATSVIFLSLYVFKINSNIHDLFYLITYSVLGALSLFGFIFYLSTYNKRKQKNVIGTKRGVRISKYLANAGVIVLLIVEFINKEVSDFAFVISLFSIASYFAQIIIEVIRVVYERYAELFSIALAKDTAALNVILDPKGSFYDKINAPLEALTNKLGEAKPIPEPSARELYVEQLTKEHEAAKKSKKEESIKEKKAQIKNNVKFIWQNIFKKKTKVVKIEQKSKVKQVASKEEPLQITDEESKPKYKQLK